MKTRFKGKGNSRLSSIFTNKSQTLRVNDSEKLICAGNAGNASSVIGDLFFLGYSCIGKQFDEETPGIRQARMRRGRGRK